jgi:hypothetical protein
VYKALNIQKRTQSTNEMMYWTNVFAEHKATRRKLGRFGLLAPLLQPLPETEQGQRQRHLPTRQEAASLCL